MKWISTGVMTAFALATTSASALPVFDMSISAGLNRSNLDAYTNFSVPTDSYSGTKPRVTFNASVGPLIGVELGWSKLASNTTVVQIIPPGGPAIDEELKESGTAVWLAYAPSIEFGAFELTGKVGAARVFRDLIITRLDENLANPANDTVIGLAGTYWFTSLVGLRVDAEQFGSEVSQVGISLTIGF